MILVAYRHGLRASELTNLRWDQIDFATATLHVRRVKQGSHSTHPIIGDELRMLRRLQREQEPKSHFVFTSERGSPFTTAGFARMVERAGVEAKLAFKAHPHAAACLRIRAGGQGTRHARPPGLPRAQEYPAHGALHLNCHLPASKASGGLDRAPKHAFTLRPGEGKTLIWDPFFTESRI
jgi:integrase